MIPEHTGLQLPAPREEEDTAQGVDGNYPSELEDEARKRAAKVFKSYSGIVPFEDLMQEARIWCATHPDTIAAHLADPAQGIAYTGWAIGSMLAKMCLRELKRRDDTAFYSFEELQERGMLEGL